MIIKTKQPIAQNHKIIKTHKIKLRKMILTHNKAPKKMFKIIIIQPTIRLKILKNQQKLLKNA